MISIHLDYLESKENLSECQPFSESSLKKYNKFQFETNESQFVLKEYKTFTAQSRYYASRDQIFLYIKGCSFGKRKLLQLVLWQYNNWQVVFSSQKTMASWIGKSRETVNRYLQEFVRIGILKKHKRFRQTNVYELRDFMLFPSFQGSIYPIINARVGTHGKEYNPRKRSDILASRYVHTQTFDEINRFGCAKTNCHTILMKNIYMSLKNNILISKETAEEKKRVGLTEERGCFLREGDERHRRETFSTLWDAAACLFEKKISMGDYSNCGRAAQESLRSIPEKDLKKSINEKERSVGYYEEMRRPPHLSEEEWRAIKEAMRRKEGVT